MQAVNEEERINPNRFHGNRKSGPTDVPVRPHLAKALASGDANAVFDCLTGKQRAFVEEYVKDLNGSAAVLRAHYNTTNANRLATQLLRNPGVRFAIDAIKAERTKNSDVTTDYVLKEIVRIVERCKADEDFNPNAALRGLELIAKHLGMFIERTEITGKDGEAIQLQKIKEDADDFTSAIAGLASRAGKTGMAPVPVTGTSG